MGTERRGWRERLEDGIYRSHRTACASSVDHRDGRRCGCPLQVVLSAGGKKKWITLDDAGLVDARRARARAATEHRAIRAAPTAGDETLHAFAASWFRARSATLRPATIKIHARAYKHRIAPTLGAVRLEDLTRERLEAWLGELVQRDPAHRAVEQSIATLRAMLSTAVEWDRLAVNPALRLRMPKRAESEHAAVERVLTPEQVERMVAKAGHLRGETMLRCAAEGGLRLGEIIGLRWSDVLLEERRLRVGRSVWQAKGGARVTHTPKSGKARRVAISSQLAERLGAYFDEQVIEGGAAADGYVWPGRGGEPLGAGSPGQYLERVLIRAGLATPRPEPPTPEPLVATVRKKKPRPPKPFITFHGLRHTAAALAFGRGVPLLVVSRQLGHASPAVTAKVYAHLHSDSQLDEFAAAFGDTTLRERLREAETADDVA
jgi:integrase